MRVRQWIRIRIRPWGLVVGSLVTVAVTGGYLTGVFDRLTLAGLDIAFRRLNRLGADPRIVLIDIDDSAIDRIGRWPWPRRTHADLVDALAEAGAAAVVMDVLFPEPQARRLEHPALSADFDVDAPATLLGELRLDDAIRDDDELEAAIRRAGNVYLAMFCRLAPPGASVDELGTTSAQPPQPGREPGAGALRRERSTGGSAATQDPSLFRRIVGALESDFALSAEQLASALGTSVDPIERDLAEAKDLVARRRVSEYLQDRPDAPFDEVRRSWMPGVLPDDRSPDRQDLLRAYRYVRAVGAVVARTCPLSVTLCGHVAQAVEMTPPLEKLTAAATRVGFVTFEGDAVDGVLRRIPLVAACRSTDRARPQERLIQHLGLAVACDVLDLDAGSWTFAKDGFLTATSRSRDRAWRIPIDEDGGTLIHWRIDCRARERWDRTFTHFPAARVLEVRLNRRAMAENEAVLALTRARAVRLRFGDGSAGYSEYAGLVVRRNDLEKRRPGGKGEEPPGKTQSPSRSPLPLPSPPQEEKNVEAGTESLDAIEARIAAIERESIEWLAYTVRSLGDLEPESAAEAAQFTELRELHEKLVNGTLQAEVERKNVELAERTARRLAELREKVGGRVCFVGYTASATADSVNTPVFKNMPGVLAHANVFNMMAQNRLPRVTSRGLGAVVLVVCGWIVTVLTSSRGPFVSLIGVGWVLAAVLIPAAGVFYWRDVYLDCAPVAIPGVFVAWAFITLYRQVVEERQRRLIAKSLARQTSPAIAAQIARGKTEADFVPQPAEVTCYFSDLQGFTTLSEAVGAERTQQVLNRYLGAMSRVLLRHQGSSKFMGDGIFAYFNAPIWIHADHAVAGCEAALECQEMLAQLQCAEAGGSFAAEFGSLVMRAGLTSGPAFAGIYGSGDRVEYTCIGDTVNLAARLESANKLFGTRILVSHACRQRAGDRFAFRYLGKLQVKGKARTADVYELLGRTAQVDGGVLSYAEAFADAVERFQRRQWDRADEAFERCRALRADDAAVSLYRVELRRLRAAPPADDWNQAIEMTTK